MSPSLTLLDLVNFGMAVAIWMVQLIVYPGFAFYPPERLVSWHARYTRRISLVVPLLVRTNWPRTLLWSAVFLVGLFFS